MNKPDLIERTRAELLTRQADLEEAILSLSDRLSDTRLGQKLAAKGEELAQCRLLLAAIPKPAEAAKPLSAELAEIGAMLPAGAAEQALADIQADRDDPGPMPSFLVRGDTKGAAA